MSDRPQPMWWYNYCPLSPCSLVYIPLTFSKSQRNQNSTLKFLSFRVIHLQSPNGVWTTIDIIWFLLLWFPFLPKGKVKEWRTELRRLDVVYLPSSAMISDDEFYPSTWSSQLWWTLSPGGMSELLLTKGSRNLLSLPIESNSSSY